MVAETSWRELCRFDDLLQARAVATSIAAMEFEVRLCASEKRDRTDPADHPGEPPYVVQVTPAQWQDLAEVLDQIIGEQQEFDRWLAEHRAAGRRIRVVSVICWAGAVELLVLLALLDW